MLMIRHVFPMTTREQTYLHVIVWHLLFNGITTLVTLCFFKIGILTKYYAHL